MNNSTPSYDILRTGHFRLVGNPYKESESIVILFRTVLDHALFDYIRGRVGELEYEQWTTEGVIVNYYEDDVSEWLGSEDFLEVCEYASLDPDFVLQEFEKLKNDEV